MKKGAMKKGFLFLSRIGFILGLFSFCSMAMAGGVEMPPPAFDGFSVIGGVNATALKGRNYSWQQAVIATGLPSGVTVNLPMSTQWGVAGRAGVEFGEAVYSPSFYLGANVNFLTGATWNKLINQPALFNPTTGNTFVSTNEREEITVNYVVDALLKIGYIWRSKVLFFFAAGGTGANVTFTSHSTVTNINLGANYKWVPGVVGDAGVEWMMARKLFMGVDYSYAAYQRMYHTVSAATAANAETGWAGTNISVQRIGLYLKYMLNL